MNKTKNCIICGKEFIFRQPNAEVCSNSCRCKRYYLKYREKELARGLTRYFNYKKNNYEQLRAINIKATQKYKNKNKEIIKLRDREYNKRTGQALKYHDRVYFGNNKKLALERDNHQCVLCGETKNLLVHHIDKSGNKKDANNTPSNLQTLCKSCHINIHRDDLKAGK